MELQITKWCEFMPKPSFTFPLHLKITLKKPASVCLFHAYKSFQLIDGYLKLKCQWLNKFGKYVNLDRYTYTMLIPHSCVPELICDDFLSKSSIYLKYN